MNESKTNRTLWVDVAKFMAIIAVLIDHTIGTLYVNGYVEFISFFSVSLFILVMGITTMWSYSKNSNDLYKKVLNKISKILKPYAVATVIYFVFSCRYFDFEAILNNLTHFNGSSPFYYVLLYIQLVIVSPLLFYVFKKSRDIKWGFVIEIFAFLVVLLIASLTTNYSYILGVYGGGGKLFGGTYLILLYLGMWFGKYYDKITINPILAGILSLVMCGCAIGCWLFISTDMFRFDAKLPFGGGLNPPGVSLILYAIIVAAAIYFLEIFLKKFPNGIPLKIMEKLAFVGKHTLYIFLYHRFFLDIILPGLSNKTGISFENMWIKRVVYFAFMIGGSLLIEFVLGKLHKIVLDAYKNKEKV